MTITGWVAVAILIFMDGSVLVVNHSKVLESKEKCEAIQKAAVEGSKEVEGLIALGMSCVPVNVTEVKNPKMPSKPVPPSVETKKE